MIPESHANIEHVSAETDVVAHCHRRLVDKLEWIATTGEVGIL